MVENYCPHLGGQVDSTPHSRHLVVEIIEFFALTQPILKVCRMAKGGSAPWHPCSSSRVGDLSPAVSGTMCRRTEVSANGCTENDVPRRMCGNDRLEARPTLVRAPSPAWSPSLTLLVGQPYFTPFGYTRILLASPVFKRSMATAKSFIGRRSVITGRRSSRPLVSSAVIWYHVWYIRRPLMP
jgi:hypothetical protein